MTAIGAGAVGIATCGSDRSSHRGMQAIVVASQGYVIIVDISTGRSTDVGHWIT